jgi:hypothetical protein
MGGRVDLVELEDRWVLLLSGKRVLGASERLRRLMLLLLKLLAHATLRCIKRTSKSAVACIMFIVIIVVFENRWL